MTEPCPHSDADGAAPAPTRSRLGLGLATAVPVVLIVAVCVAFLLPDAVGGWILAGVAATILVFTALAWRSISLSAKSARAALILLLAATALVHLVPRGA